MNGRDGGPDFSVVKKDNKARKVSVRYDETGRETYNWLSHEPNIQ